MTILLTEVEAHLNKLGIPEGWTTYDAIAPKPVDWASNGIIFLRHHGIISMCILDVRNTDKNFNNRKGPLTLEVFTNGGKSHGTSWVPLLDADTPEEIANAAFNYMTIGVPNEV